VIGLRRRQVFRLRRGLKRDGASSLVSKHRGRPSNHRLPAEVRALALSPVHERYADFGPTLAAEKLAEHHRCSVSRETLRGWMIADGLWQDRRHRLAAPARRSTPTKARCHFYFARPVPFLSCADIFQRAGTSLPDPRWPGGARLALISSSLSIMAAGQETRRRYVAEDGALHPAR
jgi:hypothetical protein